MIEVEVGSDAQNLTLSLDTESAETFVNGPSCTKCTGGTYDGGSSDSSIVQDELGSLEMGYVDGRRVSGKYFVDSITISSDAVRNTTFAVSDDVTSSGYGIMGIGQPSLETRYPSILDNMKAQGLRNSRSYSLQAQSQIF